MSHNQMCYTEVAGKWSWWDKDVLLLR